jgi:hypothetical protein
LERVVGPRSATRVRQHARAIVLEATFSVHEARLASVKRESEVLVVIATCDPDDRHAFVAGLEAAVQEELSVQDHLHISRSLEVDDAAVLAHRVHVDPGSKIEAASFSVQASHCRRERTFAAPAAFTTTLIGTFATTFIIAALTSSHVLQVHLDSHGISCADRGVGSPITF